MKHEQNLKAPPPLREGPKYQSFIDEVKSPKIFFVTRYLIGLNIRAGDNTGIWDFCQSLTVVQFMPGLGYFHDKEHIWTGIVTFLNYFSL